MQYSRCVAGENYRVTHMTIRLRSILSGVSRIGTTRVCKASGEMFSRTHSSLARPLQHQSYSEGIHEGRRAGHPVPATLPSHERSVRENGRDANRTRTGLDILLPLQIGGRSTHGRGVVLSLAPRVTEFPAPRARRIWWGPAVRLVRTGTLRP